MQIMGFSGLYVDFWFNSKIGSPLGSKLRS